MYVVYWSGTGNTEAMANAVGAGIESAGQEAKVIAVSDISAADLLGEQAFALGCSSQGAEELEESEMEPFVAELESQVAGKKIALFGSYGWGDGEWMRNWVQRMQAAGAEVVGGEGVICMEAPDDEATASCEALGKALVG